MTPSGSIKRKVIEGAAAGPHLLITGGVHGDEFEPMTAIRRLASIVQPQELRGRLTLIPIANEAAFLRGSRTAEDELDLARTFPGRHDGSTTEQVAHALSAWIRQADYYIDLHTGGTALMLLPFTGYMLHADTAVLDWQRRMARAFNLPIVWGTTPALEGRSLSVARDAHVPAIYAEYLGGGRCSGQGVDAFVAGCLNVMGELGMIECAKSVSQIEHVVEDTRENSGHLQINHPAPVAGCFEAMVELGQWVQQGERLGQVVADALGEQVYEIRADHAGIVLGLATFPRVLARSSVAIVLDVDGSATPNAR